MKIINFIPLFLWAMFFLPLVTYTNKMESHTPGPKEVEGIAMWYLLGCLGWLVIGAICAAT